MLELLLDSVILIDHLNGLEKATAYISELSPSNAAISVITRAEILVGFSGQQNDTIKALLDHYDLLCIDKKAADMAAELRRTNRWKLPDAFQAALAINAGVKLVTRNTKDFNPSNHSFVHIPYQVD
jgi:hypothetical protein